MVKQANFTRKANNFSRPLVCKSSSLWVV